MICWKQPRLTVRPCLWCSAQRSQLCSWNVLAWLCWCLSLVPSARSRLCHCKLENYPRRVVSFTHKLGRKYRGDLFLCILPPVVHWGTQETFRYKRKLTPCISLAGCCSSYWQHGKAGNPHSNWSCLCWYRRPCSNIGVLDLWSVRIGWGGKSCHQVKLFPVNWLLVKLVCAQTPLHLAVSPAHPSGLVSHWPPHMMLNGKPSASWCSLKLHICKKGNEMLDQLAIEKSNSVRVTEGCATDADD